MNCLRKYSNQKAAHAPEITKLMLIVKEFSLHVWVECTILKQKKLKDMSLNSHLSLIVYAHPYCARNSCRNAILRHARARAQRKKSVLMKGWYPLR